MSDVFYEDDLTKLIHADSFEYLDKMKSESIDVIFADPPYFLSGNGISNSGGKMVNVNKGEWDKSISIEEKHAYNREWLKNVEDY